MPWEIKPFVGLGPVLFGMTEAGVAALGPALGPVERRLVEPDGSVNEHRGMGAPTLSYRNGRVCYIAAGWRVGDVIWQGIDVFQADPKTVVQMLEVANGGAEVGLGSLSFGNLGLSADGFYVPKTRRFFRRTSADQDDRSIALYDRDVWNSQAEQLKSYQEPITFMTP
jgi:hypothetical protein